MRSLKWISVLFISLPLLAASKRAYYGTATFESVSGDGSGLTGVPISGLSGTLPIANGGTNSSTALSGNSIMISNGSAIVQGAAGTTTTLLHGNASGSPTYSAVSLSADITGTLSGSNVSGGTFGAVNGSALTSLTAGNITGSHTLPDGVLSTNVPLLNAANNFTAATALSTTSITGGLTIVPGADGINMLGKAHSGTAAYLRFLKSDASGYVGNLDFNDSGSLTIGTSGLTSAVTISATQAVRFNAYGAGTITSDASGNLTSVSDARLKDIQGPFKRGLLDILKITPIVYRWNKVSGMDQANLYAGFSAQDVQKAIPEATIKNRDGYYSFQDRAVLAAAVNAIKDLSAKMDKLDSRLKSMEAKNGN